MKVEQAKQITTKALADLVTALESGHSEALTAYLKTMSLFTKYSMCNLFLIARQRAVTCCYTSLESMNMRSFALLEASDGA